MPFVCPTCGSRSCIASADNIINAAPTLYSKCAHCNDLFLEKNHKIDLADIDFAGSKCKSCDRRPLDAVMAHALALCVENKRNPNVTLREVGTPLLSPGVPTFAPPHLGAQNLVLLTHQRIVADAAKDIMREVPEVKAVLLGDAQSIIGLKSMQDEPYVCTLIEGCDLRGDLISSAYGQILIYKSQSKLHIEHDNQRKMHNLGTIPLAGRSVLDSLAGPGTLGLMSLLMGAKNVILNDAWLPAVENAYLNLHVNKEVLGIHTIKRDRSYAPNSLKGDAPKLFCTAATDEATIELYHGSFERLNTADLDAEILLVDPFPGMMPVFKRGAERIMASNPGTQIYFI